MEQEFEITEHPKPIPSRMDYVTPALEGAVIIKKKIAQKEQIETIHKKEKEEANSLLGKLATSVFLTEKALERFEDTLIKKDLKNVYREFRVLKNQMRRSLEEYGILIVDPQGIIFDDELEEKVEVIGWVFGEGEKRVKETHVPIITRNNSTIKLGQVVVSSPSATKKIHNMEVKKL